MHLIYIFCNNYLASTILPYNAIAFFLKIYMIFKILKEKIILLKKNVEVYAL